MNTNLGKWIIGYGVFLMAMGLAGYLSNPEKAKTALLSGGIFGGLSLLWGFLHLQGRLWSRWACLGTTSLLAAVFAWRASVSWSAVADGNTDKWIAATLITAMGLGSLAMLALLAVSIGRCGKGS